MQPKTLGENNLSDGKKGLTELRLEFQCRREVIAGKKEKIYLLIARRRRRSSHLSFARIVDLLIIAAGEFRVLCQDVYNIFLSHWGARGPLFCYQ